MTWRYIYGVMMKIGHLIVKPGVETKSMQITDWCFEKFHLIMYTDISTNCVLILASLSLRLWNWNVNVENYVMSIIYIFANGIHYISTNMPICMCMCMWRKAWEMILLYSHTIHYYGIDANTCWPFQNSVHLNLEV